MEEKIEICKVLFHFGLLLCFVWYVQYHWKRRRLYQMASKIPGPFSLPLIGNALYFAVPNTEILYKILRTMSVYKSPMRMWFGQQLAVFLWQPRDIEIVLNSAHALDKEMMIYRHYDFALGKGLGTAPAKLWKKNRRLIAPTFKQRNLNGFMPVFLEQSKVLVRQLRQEIGAGIFDCFPYVNKCTMDMICETALGVQIHSQTTDSKVLKWIDESMNMMAEKISRIWFHVDFIFKQSDMSKKLDENFGQLVNFIDEIIMKWKNTYQKGLPEEAEEIEESKTFLQQLLRVSENGASFTNNQLRDEVITFILAGSETTGSTLGFVLIILGLFPEVQDRVYHEVMEVVGASGIIECEDLPRLEYMERVVKETMRILPVGPSMARSASGDIKLETCVIPAGSTIAIEVIGLHRNPKIWPNPLEFNPDRFLPEEVAKRHPYSWLPFSGGPRNCIGVKYAWMSMKTVLATLLRNYKITTDYKNIDSIRLKHNITLRPTHGYKIGIEDRPLYLS